MIKTSACPMDCYDACEVVYDNGTIKPSKTHPITNGKLCKLFAYLLQEKNLEDKNLHKTLKKVSKKLKKAKSILYYKGSGNMGVMNNTPKLFFDRLKSTTFATGSLCDLAGEAGIKKGRGVCVNPPISKLKEAEVVVVWGRNLTKTSSHIYKLIEDKEFITIDPYKTEIASKSKLFLQIPPKSDYLLVRVINRFLKGKKIKKSDLKKLNIKRSDLKRFVKLLKGKKVALMLGIGAQKYYQGADIFHKIEKLFNKFGIFDKTGCGSWYLANSSYPYKNPFKIKQKRSVKMSEVDFSKYDIVFIQGANPIISAPNSSKIKKQLKKSFVIFFGTTLNDTAKQANIIIPAKNFLQKRDVRLSYGHDEVVFTQKCEDNPNAISEYEFTKFMFDEFGFKGLKEEEFYLNHYKKAAFKKPKTRFKPQKTAKVKPLKRKKDEFFLLTSKHENTLNSQFKYDNFAYIHHSCEIKEGDFINISSKYGKARVKVKFDKNLHKNCILLKAGNKFVNHLTPDRASKEGDNATFQDVVVKITQ
jgi:anaerobic selenocysteine-containing dehydrogenase